MNNETAKNGRNTEQDYIRALKLNDDMLLEAYWTYILKTKKWISVSDGTITPFADLEKSHMQNIVAMLMHFNSNASLEVARELINTAKKMGYDISVYFKTYF